MKKLTTKKTLTFREMICGECGARARLRAPRKCFTGSGRCSGKLQPREPILDPESGKPAKCERSKCGGEAHLRAYWGELLCGRCARDLARLLDEADEWP